MSVQAIGLKYGILITGTDGLEGNHFTSDKEKCNYYESGDRAGKLLAPKFKKSNLVNFISANKNSSDKTVTDW